MRLVEGIKEGYCAVCGAKIKDEYINYSNKWIEDTTLLHIPFICSECGMSGENDYYISWEYVGTNGWIPENN